MSLHVIDVSLPRFWPSLLMLFIITGTAVAPNNTVLREIDKTLSQGALMLPPEWCSYVITRVVQLGY